MAKKNTLTEKKAQSATIVTQAGAQENEALQGIDSEQRRSMIAEKAYLIAELRGFQGEAVEDWLQAEADVDARLAAGTQVSH